MGTAKDLQILWAVALFGLGSCSQPRHEKSDEEKAAIREAETERYNAVETQRAIAVMLDEMRTHFGECVRTWSAETGRSDAKRNLQKHDRRLRVAFSIAQEAFVPRVPPLTVTNASCRGMCEAKWIEGRQGPKGASRRYEIVPMAKYSLYSEPPADRAIGLEYKEQGYVCNKVMLDYVKSYNGIILGSGKQ